VVLAVLAAVVVVVAAVLHGHEAPKQLAVQLAHERGDLLLGRQMQRQALKVLARQQVQRLGGMFEQRVEEHAVCARARARACQFRGEAKEPTHGPVACKTGRVLRSMSSTKVSFQNGSPLGELISEFCAFSLYWYGLSTSPTRS